MMTIKNCFLTLVGFFASTISLLAQSPSTKTDFLESSGKIYVVVAVIALIFIGILALLISLERRLAKLEKEQDNTL